MSKYWRYLIYCLFFLLPWQTKLILRQSTLNGGVWEYGLVAVYATEIFLWLLSLFFLVSGGWKQIKLNKKQKWFTVLVGLFLLVNFFVAKDKMIFVQQLIHLLEASWLVWLVRKIKPDFRFLCLSFGMGLLIQAGLGIAQFLTQTTWANRWFGLTLHNPAVAGSSILENWGGRWLRAYGGLTHPNVLGGYLVLGIILGLIFLAFFLKPQKIRLAVLIGEGILTTALFFTFSRSAGLSLIVGLVSVIIISRPRLLAEWKKIIPSLGLIIILLGSLTWIFQPLVFGRVTGEGRLEQQSVTERLNSYEEVQQIIKNNFWLGVGLGNYTLAVYQQTDFLRQPWDYQPIHNTFVLLLAEVGLAGCLMFLFFGYKFYHLNYSWFLFLLPLFLLDHYFWSSLSGLWLLAATISFSFLLPQRSS